MSLQLAGSGGGGALSGTIAEWLWLIPVLPLLGFIINGALSLTSAAKIGPRDPTIDGHEHHDHGAAHSHDEAHAEPARHRFAGVVSVIGPLVLVLSFALSVAIFGAMVAARSHEPFVRSWFTWIVAGDLHLDAALQLDALSMVMVLVITGVGTLIHIFSVGYMRDDPGYPRYFAYLNLFVFFMLVLVLGASYPVLFVGWEGVGLCSYLLIGFWFSDKANADAGKKAFIVNRIGDFGFLVAMFLMFANFGALDFAGVRAGAMQMPFGGALITTICLFLFLGCIGKSAQIPLYVWLPDAMAGPTPVSALIHAATMVTAGVYLIARSNFLFSLAPAAGLTVAVIGGLTALFAATIGLKQWDIKKVLAYSTVSQLGYMFVGVGVGAYTAGMFHLVTHAFFKALLFLGSGSVIFAMHRAYHATHSHDDAQDMRNMGGLKQYMPVTFWLMWIATLAIAGIPLFSGFFSKDAILGFVVERAHDSTLAHTAWLGISGKAVLYAVYAMGLAAALLTAIYMTRMMLYTFHGPNRSGDKERAQLGEAPWIMTAPLIVLGILSAVGGWLNLPEVVTDLIPLGPRALLDEWLDPVVGESMARVAGGAPRAAATTEEILIGVAVAIALAGIAIAVARLKPAVLVPKANAPEEQGIERVLAHKYYVDELYDRAIVNPTLVLSEKVLWKGVDSGIIDTLGVNWIAAGIPRLLAWFGSTVQNGQVGRYAWALVVGVILVVGALTLS
jgi:NADH-quinone oxidoreductase subunit L